MRAIAVDEKILRHVPEPPEIRYPGHPGMSADVQDAWRQTYARELKRLLGGQQAGDAEIQPTPQQHQAALCEANKLHISVEHPETCEEAHALPRWKYLVPPHAEDEKDGNGNLTGRKLLRGLTIDGKALRGPNGRRGIPEPEEKAAAA
jgi:hypothetical protein